jgi:hypothetical protein
MALFQKRILLRAAKADPEAPLGLVAPARCVNSEELFLNMEMHRCTDGILGFFCIFANGGELQNMLLPPRAGDKRETDLAQFMRLAGLTEVPTIDEVMTIKRDALARLEAEWAPRIQAARMKGPDI